jgi:hypothetical protein
MNSDSSYRLDLEKYGSPIFTGRPNGELARTKYSLDSWDDENARVEVLVPDSAKVLNSSFLLGLLGPSIQHYASKESFLDHYHFVIPPRFEKQLEKTIERALFKTLDND